MTDKFTTKGFADYFIEQRGYIRNKFYILIDIEKIILCNAEQ